VTPLSPRQQEVLDYLKSYQASQGYCPSVREIGRALGLKSSATVQRHLDGLEKQGHIKRAGIRAIRILREGEQ